MRVNKALIKSEYRTPLKDYHSRVKALTIEERSKAIEYTKMYYSYLASNGISYARLALEVVENKGKFGQIANIQLKSQSIFEGIKEGDIPEVREKIIVSLASHDSKMRCSKSYHAGNLCYQQIEKYHKKVFETYTTIYAWGGLAMKELIGSGSWMKYYEQEEDCLGAIQDVLKSKELGCTSGYSIERMLQSVLHSFRVFSLGIEMPFMPTISTFSKEQAVKIWQIDESRIEELAEDRSMLDSSMVESKAFKILPAQEFYANYISDYSSSSDSDSSDDNGTLAGQKKINTMYRKLFSNPEELKQYQQESIDEAMKGLKIAEGEIPDITAACVKSVHADQEFMQLLGVGCSSSALQELDRVDQAIEQMSPQLNNVMQQFRQQQKLYVQNFNTTPQEEQASSSLQEVKWLDDVIENSRNMISQMQDDPEMQELMNNLAGNMKFFDTDQLG